MTERKTTFDLPDEEYKELRHFSIDNGVSIKDMIRIGLQLVRELDKKELSQHLTAIKQ